MQNKIISVFYDANRLPFKDAQRTIHYPLVSGDVFNGANNVTTIRYYIDRIGGATNVTWVVVSKLPNGQIANEVLNSNNAVLDSELGEHYIEFSISSYYTTLKGDLYLSLNGYQGGVEVEQDEDTGIYSIYGTPTIQATGSIKIGINYAPQMIQGTHFNTSDLQQVLGALSDKANISDIILVVDNINSEDLSDYQNGQIFFDRETYCFYRKSGLSYVDVTIPNLVTLNNTSGTLTTTQLAIVKKPDALILTPNGLCRKLSTGDDILQIFISTPVIGVNSINLSILNYVVVSILNGNYTINTNTYNFYSKDQADNKFATIVYVDDKDTHTITLGTASGTLTNEQYELVQKDNTIIIYNNNYYTKKMSNDNYIEYRSINDYVSLGASGVIETTLYITITKATKEYSATSTSNQFYTTTQTNSKIATAVASLKANEFQVVEELPQEGEEGIIYLIEISSGVYQQYIWEGENYIDLGTTQIDLSDYYTKTQADNKFVAKTTTIAGVDLQDNITAQELTDALVFMNNTTDLDYVMED